MKTLVLRVPLIMLFGDGLCLCPWLVLIRWEVSVAIRKHLIPHELRHVEQQRRDGLLTFWCRYLSSEKHKLAYEVDAYKVSMQHGMSPWEAAYLISRDYELDDDGTQITHDEAAYLLATQTDTD